MGKITRHGKQRLVQRCDDCESFLEAKRLAKLARTSGKTVDQFSKYPKFYIYLQNKNNKTNSQSIRVYKGQIFIWKGKNTFMTAFPIPRRYLKEMEAIDNG